MTSITIDQKLQVSDKTQQDLIKSDVEKHASPQDEVSTEVERCSCVQHAKKIWLVACLSTIILGFLPAKLTTFTQFDRNLPSSGTGQVLFLMIYHILRRPRDGHCHRCKRVTEHGRAPRYLLELVCLIGERVIIAEILQLRKLYTM